MTEFLRDENAQATTEYILMLFVAVSTFLILYSKLLKPMIANLSKRLSDSITGALVTGDLHRYPLKR